MYVFVNRLYVGVQLLKSHTFLFEMQANKKGPEFATTYNNIEQKILVHFTTLEVLLHQEALLSIVEFAQVLHLDWWHGAWKATFLIKHERDTISTVLNTENFPLNKVEYQVEKLVKHRKTESAMQIHRYFCSYLTYLVFLCIYCRACNHPKHLRSHSNPPKFKLKLVPQQRRTKKMNLSMLKRYESREVS